MKKYIKIALLIVLFFSLKGTVFAANVNLTVRDGGTVVFTGSVAIPTGVTSLNDSTNTPQTIDPSSVLAVLSSASTQTGSTWSISNLTYYSSFGELYLKCITDSVGNECDNWQYTVNNSYPSDGMDQHILNDGDNVYVYFGPQNQVVLSGSNITTNDTLTVTAQTYNYQNNTWTTRTGVTVGLTQPDPNNTYSPIEVLTSSVDSNGEATFSNIPAGSYNVGIKEDYYFPTSTLTVTTASVVGSGGGQLVSPTNSASTTNPTSTTSNTTAPATTTVTPPVNPSFDTNKALDFLTAEQKEDGTFGADLYTDWSAMALASAANSNSNNKIN